MAADVQSLSQAASLSGEAVLARCRDGDAEAFAELIRPHEERLFRQAMGLCRDATRAGDLAQETIVEAWRSIGRFEGGCRFSTWLYAIMLRRHRKSLRTQRRKPLSFFGLFRPDESSESAGGQRGFLEGVDPAPNPAERAVNRERASRVATLVERLPPRHRDVIRLRFYAEATVDEISAALGCSEGTVKSRLHYALLKLRAMNLEGRR